MWPRGPAKDKIEQSVEAIRGREKYGTGGAYALLSELIPRPDTVEADAAVLLLATALSDLYLSARKA